MTPWSRYVQDIRPMLPGCPQVVIRGVLRNVAQDFCESSLTWQDTIDPIFVSCTDRNIIIEPPDDGVVVQFEYLGFPCPPGVTTDPLVPFDSSQYVERDPTLEPRTEGWLDAMLPGWRSVPGQPRYYTRPTRDVLWLAPHPPTDIVLRAKVTLKPADTALGTPDDMFRDFRRAIQDGALTQLLRFPGKKWTNVPLAEKYQSEFENGIGEAVTRQSRSNTKAPIRTRMNIRF